MAYLKYSRQSQPHWFSVRVYERGEQLYFDGAGAPLINDWIDRHINSRFKSSTFIIWNGVSFIAGLITFAIWVS